MIDNSVIMLEDNNKYNVVDKIEDDGVYYIYLVNTKDENDLVVRKEIVNKNEEHYLIGLDNNEELERALDLFLEKNKQD